MNESTQTHDVQTNFDPAFDDETMYRIEKSQQKNADIIGVSRRIALAVLTKTSEEIRQGIQDEEGAIQTLNARRD